VVSVGAAATGEQIERVSHAHGRSRLAVVDEAGAVIGVLHVRDALRATSAGRPATARQLMTPPVALPAAASVLAAGQAMRADRAQLAVVTDAGAAVGIVALEDLLEEIIGEFDDETDHNGTAKDHPTPNPATSPTSRR
jgi:CBS domain containing-hemolysin-like protein